MSDGYFMTGTDTGVGKSVASAALMRFLVDDGRRVAGLKPIASGFEWQASVLCNDDVELIKSASNVALPGERINRYGFEPAIAPHIAADLQGVSIDITLIKDDLQFALEHADTVVVEGVGGWKVPLSTKDSSVDIEALAQCLKLPVILVVAMRLGCLNHAILSATAIRSAGLNLLGWVANRLDPHFSHCEENIATLEALMPAPKLFELAYSAHGYRALKPINTHSALLGES